MKGRAAEGGVAGVLGGCMIFRGAPQQSETTLVKQNRKLVHKSGFRFWEAPSRHVELFEFSSEIEVLGPRFEKSRFLFGLFRGAPPKSETTFRNQRVILFHKCGLRFSGLALEHHAKNPTSILLHSLFLFFCF